MLSSTWRFAFRTIFSPKNYFQGLFFFHHLPTNLMFNCTVEGRVKCLLDFRNGNETAWETKRGSYKFLLQRLPNSDCPVTFAIKCWKWNDSLVCYMDEMLDLIYQLNCGADSFNKNDDTYNTFKFWKRWNSSLPHKSEVVKYPSQCSCGFCNETTKYTRQKLQFSVSMEFHSEFCRQRNIWFLNSVSCKHRVY